ncbi:MAG: translation initiation factor IF-2 subunit alpha [Candidatus Asgardarchaeia archaeon]
MSHSKNEYPEEGELVIATVTKIKPYGAFVALDEYKGKEGMIHISEVSTKWVKNIRTHLRVGQKVVAKVLRVIPEKMQIDLSLRRVTKQQKIMKIQSWKHRKRAEKLLELLAEKLDAPLAEVYEKVASKLEQKYGELYTSFELAKEKGISILLKAGIDETYAKALYELIDSYIKLPSVIIHGVFEIRSYASNGVDIIKNALSKGKSVVKSGKRTVIRIYTIGAPKYRVEVEAPNYQVAEDILKKVVDTVISELQDKGAIATFSREK